MYNTWRMEKKTASFRQQFLLHIDDFTHRLTVWPHIMPLQIKHVLKQFHVSQKCSQLLSRCCYSAVLVVVGTLPLDIEKCWKNFIHSDPLFWFAFKIIAQRMLEYQHTVSVLSVCLVFFLLSSEHSAYRAKPGSLQSCRIALCCGHRVSISQTKQTL